MVLYTKVILFYNSFLPFPSHSFQTLYPCLILLLIFNCSLHYKQRKRTHFPSIIKRRVGLETSQMTSLAASKNICAFIFLTVVVILGETIQVITIYSGAISALTPVWIFSMMLPDPNPFHQILFPPFRESFSDGYPFSLFNTSGLYFSAVFYRLFLCLCVYDPARQCLLLPPDWEMCWCICNYSRIRY